MSYKKEDLVGEKEESLYTKKLVIFNRCLNEQDFTVLSSKELNILFSLLYMARWYNYTEGTQIKNLKTLANIKRTDFDTLEIQFNNVKQFLNDGKFAIFRSLEFDKENKTFSYRLNDSFKYLFDINNTLNKKEYLTIFNLDIFTKIKSKYDKNIYRLLIDYSGSGWVKTNKDEFIKAIGLPKSYNSAQKNHKLKDCLKNLECYFPCISVETIKGVVDEEDYLYIKWNNKNIRELNGLDPNT